MLFVVLKHDEFSILVLIEFQVYLGSGDYIGTTGSVPLVAENMLKYDSMGYSYDNGPFMIMERSAF